MGGRIGPTAVAWMMVSSAMYIGVFGILVDEPRLDLSLTIVSVQPVSALYTDASVVPVLGVCVAARENFTQEAAVEAVFLVDGTSFRDESESLSVIGATLADLLDFENLRLFFKVSSSFFCSSSCLQWQTSDRCPR